ncbi:MAG: tyrosine-type recombinase/integrase [Acidimicrobiia bacterium]
MPFVADTGLRIGEAAGLRWRDLDLRAGTVRVREVLVEVHGTATFGPPKTSAGRRTVPTLTDEVAERMQRGAQDGFVFTGPQGGPLRPSLFRRRVCHPAIDAAALGEPDPTPHALRRTAVAHWMRPASSRTSWRSGPVIGPSRRSIASTGTCSIPTRPPSARPFL